MAEPTFRSRTHAISSARRGRLVRRLAIGAMVVFVGAGLYGVFGIRQGHQTATAAGLRFGISYPSVTRGGLPVRWELDIGTEDSSSLPDEIEIRTTADYFDIFDHNDLTPEPDATWQGQLTSWTYRPDPGDDRLRIRLDVRAQPNARWRHAASTDIVIGGDVVASFDYTTFVVP